MVEEEIYDVLILGGGPAGLTAAIYAARYNLRTLIISKESGGTANLAPEIENWPGFIGSGISLMEKFKNQAEKFGAKIESGEIVSVKKEGGLFFVETASKIINGRSLIVALGTENKKLDIPGEKEFLGKGVSYCATCDGNFFRGKTVAVVGGANSAASAALYLSTICKKVYIFYRKHEMRCEPISLDKLKEKENVEIIYFAIPSEIIGDKKVQKIKVLIEEHERSKREIELELDGIFIEIGATPLTDVVKKLNLKIDCDGYIETDKEMKTSVEGVYAAGDNTNNTLKQIVTATGEGAIAAKAVYEHLKTKNGNISEKA
jgi:thioredoxin reductase (NADPH)